jgi:hypothetical protein
MRGFDGLRLLRYTNGEVPQGMQRPYFISLAQVDRERFIATCRHGLVHVTWGRATVRFTRDEFRRLAALVEHAAAAPPPAAFRDGGLCVTSRPGEDCELQVGALILLLPRGEFDRFAQTAQDALQRLDKFLESGGWRDEPEETPPSFVEQLRRTLFSRN